MKPISNYCIKLWMLILLCFNATSCALNQSRKKSNKSPIRFHGSRSQNLFENLMKTFKILKQNGHYAKTLEETFDIKSFQLLYPTNFSKVASMKRCVLIARTKTSTTVALKFELNTSVRSGYSTITNTIKCGNHAVAEGFPTEHKLNMLMNDQDYFLKYFSSESGAIKTAADGEYVLVYANTYLNGSMDLHAWKLKHLKSLPLVEYETNLRMIFAKIYLALTALKNKEYVYTDLKPQNILIGPANDPYLIDLESVIKSNNPSVCIYTKHFFPNDLKGKHNLKSDDMERILSWTFCYSIYESICSSSGKSYRTWPHNQSFLDFFKCDKKLTSSMTQFLNQCLTKKAVNNSFSHLKTMDWLKYDLTLISH